MRVSYMTCSMPALTDASVQHPVFDSGIFVKKKEKLEKILYFE